MRAQKRAISSELAPRSSKKWSSAETCSTFSTSARARERKCSLSVLAATSLVPAGTAAVAASAGACDRLVADRHRNGRQFLEICRDHVGRQRLRSVWAISPRDRTDASCFSDVIGDELDPSGSASYVVTTACATSGNSSSTDSISASSIR